MAAMINTPKIFLFLLCSFAALIGFSVMFTPDYQARADLYAEQGAQLATEENREAAAAYVAQALAINPYLANLWAQLGYMAPEHRDQASHFAQHLTRAAAQDRLEAASSLGETP